jgi:hypothetical protein
MRSAVASSASSASPSNRATQELRAQLLATTTMGHVASPYRLVERWMFYEPLGTDDLTRTSSATTVNTAAQVIAASAHGRERLEVACG